MQGIYGEQIQALLQQHVNPLQQQLRHYQDLQAAQQQAQWGFGTAFGGALVAADFNANYDWLQDTGRYYLKPDPEAEAKRQAALQRALDLLEEKIGAAALAKIQAGGAYTVRSKWWPNVTYLVPKDPHARIKVVADGSVVTESCLVTTDASLPWPDILLHRITALELDESVLFATGVLHTMKPGKWSTRLRNLFKR